MENKVEITPAEFEQLVRDSEALRLIRGLWKTDAYLDPVLHAMFGEKGKRTGNDA